jgi:hypothetical protein
MNARLIAFLKRLHAEFPTEGQRHNRDVHNAAIPESPFPILPIKRGLTNARNFLNILSAVSQFKASNST